MLNTCLVNTHQSLKFLTGRTFPPQLHLVPGTIMTAAQLDCRCLVDDSIWCQMLHEMKCVCIISQLHLGQLSTCCNTTFFKVKHIQIFIATTIPTNLLCVFNFPKSSIHHGGAKTPQKPNHVL